MDGFKFNIKGQVNELNLPEYKALWPLFETIVNSIQSLEDSTNKDKGVIKIIAKRSEESQLDIDTETYIPPFYSFEVIDNGDGFNDVNYNSFLEAYSNLKISKGCKGIGRFLWLKAFTNVHIKSNYYDNNRWYKREFDFNANEGIHPQDNKSDSIEQVFRTSVNLDDFKPKYKRKIALTLEPLAKKIIEHCLPYFLNADCPSIILEEEKNASINLNNYFSKNMKDSLHQDEIVIGDEKFTLYHLRMNEGVNKHELHFCANNREVKSYELNKYIPDLQNRIITSNGNQFYYLGYLMGSYLDDRVNSTRMSFEFDEMSLLDNVSIKDLINASKEYIELYLSEDLQRVKEKKINEINDFVNYIKPQYRYLLNKKPELYEKIPAGLNNEKLELELHKSEQSWELEISKQGKDLEKSLTNNTFNIDEYNKIFEEYCSSITEISKASLAEYVARRKAIINLLETTLELRSDDSYNSEASVHTIICPMRYTSDEIEFTEMNLWLIDDRLAYHQFLASDKLIKSIPILENRSDKRMDISIFDKALSFTDDTNNLNSISIIEFKKPMRNDFTKDDKNPITQVLNYVRDIKNGKLKKANGRDFGELGNTPFYCYVIADLTSTLQEDAENAGLIKTPDHQGYFGYNQTKGAYIEVISYDKLLRDAKTRNQILFDKLFNPSLDKLKNK